MEDGEHEMVNDDPWSFLPQFDENENNDQYDDDDVTVYAGLGQWMTFGEHLSEDAQDQTGEIEFEYAYGCAQKFCGDCSITQTQEQHPRFVGVGHLAAEEEAASMTSWSLSVSNILHEKEADCPPIDNEQASNHNVGVSAVGEGTCLRDR